MGDRKLRSIQVAERDSCRHETLSEQGERLQKGRNLTVVKRSKTSPWELVIAAIAYQ